MLDLIDGVLWAREQPGSIAWAVATWLNASGAKPPVTAAILCGRPPTRDTE